jgi:hypothetical protein
MPWMVRKAMSWLMFVARPAPREKAAKSTQARMLAPLRPMPSEMRAKITAKPGRGLGCGLGMMVRGRGDGGRTHI